MLIRYKMWIAKTRHFSRHSTSVLCTHMQSASEMQVNLFNIILVSSQIIIFILMNPIRSLHDSMKWISFTNNQVFFDINIKAYMRFVSKMRKPHFLTNVKIIIHSHLFVFLHIIFIIFVQNRIKHISRCQKHYYKTT